MDVDLLVRYGEALGAERLVETRNVCGTVAATMPFLRDYAQQHGLELKGEIDRHESRIQFNEERLREFAAQNTKATADIADAGEHRHDFEHDIDGAVVKVDQFALRTGSTARSRRAPELKRLPADKSMACEGNNAWGSACNGN